MFPAAMRSYTYTVTKGLQSRTCRNVRSSPERKKKFCGEGEGRALETPGSRFGKSVVVVVVVVVDKCGSFDFLG